MDGNTVGEVRAQAAYCESKTPVVLVSSDPKVRELLVSLRVLRAYPDTTDENGNWNSTFKIEVSAK